MNGIASPAFASSAIAAQYEEMRHAALGYALPLEARSGLTLFLRRGMWGWARTLIATARSPKEQVTLPSAGWPVADGHSDVVHVLATIAMSIGTRGHHDRT